MRKLGPEPEIESRDGWAGEMRHTKIKLWMGTEAVQAFIPKAKEHPIFSDNDVRRLETATWLKAELTADKPWKNKLFAEENHRSNPNLEVSIPTQ